MRLIKQALFVNSLAQNRKPDEGKALTALATAFAYALDAVPTHHLEECLKRAIRGQTDDFLLTAAAVNRAYEDMLPELEHKARENAARQTELLRAGYGSLDDMTVSEWKVRHNLPLHWRLGQLYPPESDLYKGPQVERAPIKKPSTKSGWAHIGDVE